MRSYTPPPPNNTAVYQSENNDSFSLQLGQVGPYSKHSTSSGGRCTAGFPTFVGGRGIRGGGCVKCHLCSKLTRHREETFGGEVRGGRRRGLKRMWHGHGGGETRVETDGKNKIREWCLSVSTEVEVEEQRADGFFCLERVV